MKRKTKDVKLILKDLTATLEDEQWRERNLSVLYCYTSGGKTPHELIASGRESGLAKAIVIVKDELKALEDRRRERQ
jgi:hypothetical protein